jgi:hypothetical protein
MLQAEQQDKRLSSLRGVSQSVGVETNGLHALSGLDRLVALLRNDKTTGVTDRRHVDRLANLASSLPFLLHGARVLMNSDDARVQRYGFSLCGVALGSTFYHGTPFEHEHRRLARYVDYGLIGVSSVALLHALRVETPVAVKALELVAVLAHPLASTALHVGCAEAVYWRRARGKDASAERRATHSAHLGRIGLAATLFIGEEMLPSVPLIHAAWHLAAASAVADFAYEL